VAAVLPVAWQQASPLAPVDQWHVQLGGQGVADVAQPPEPQWPF
jgi:hypothetical protein